MGAKRQAKRARRQARLRAETYSPAVKVVPGASPDDFRDFFDGDAGVPEPRRPSPHAPEVGDVLEPPASDVPAP